MSCRQGGSKFIWGECHLAGELLLHGLDEVDVGEDLLLLLDVLGPGTLDGFGGGGSGGSSAVVILVLVFLLFFRAAKRKWKSEESTNE